MACNQQGVTVTRVRVTMNTSAHPHFDDKDLRTAISIMQTIDPEPLTSVRGLATQSCAAVMSGVDPRLSPAILFTEGQLTKCLSVTKPIRELVEDPVINLLPSRSLNNVRYVGYMGSFEIDEISLKLARWRVMPCIFVMECGEP